MSGVLPAGYNYTLLPRRDFEEEWERINPVLKDKEICVIYSSWTKSITYKLGDGKTPYLKLEYATLEEVLKSGVLYTDTASFKIRGLISYETP